MQKVLQTHIHEHVNIDNFVDVSLLIQLLSSRDNANVKNMFYLIKNVDGESQLYWIPWDTDLSLGIVWGYDYETCMSNIIERQEIDIIRKYYPELNAKLLTRWNELRQKDFSEENIQNKLDILTQKLSASGAIQRDFECWGQLHGGNDNIDNLRKFIQERLLMLDSFYLNNCAA